MKKVVNFLKFRYIAVALSAGLLALFIAGTAMSGGFNLGIDFVGGMKIIAQFKEGISEKDIRETLSDFNPQVQQIGGGGQNEYIISTKLNDSSSENSEVDTLKKVLQSRYPETKFLSEEAVGSAIGDILKTSAIKLFCVALVFMSIYLIFRFELKYAFAVMLSLAHDMLLTFFFIGFTGTEMNIPVVAAILTIFGYSVNDTIVIFDRIRENVRFETKQTFFEIINKSITQSLRRTLLTSLTTLFAAATLYFIGGKVLNDFAKVLIFGIIVGTYSSVYIASPLIVVWEKRANRKK
ncbi:MAG: protein translocase subunit SecF [Leptospirales bacterium]|nr:protein translocase subunit SecF [Leptospirales bacterium]